MTAFGTIRTNLAGVLTATGDYAAVYDTVPDTVVTPSAIIVPAEQFATYHTTLTGDAGAFVRFTFDVVCIAGRYDPHSSQDTLDALVDSMVADLEADQTLSGAASIVIVRTGSDYGEVTVAGSQFLGCRFLVEVYTT